MGCPLSIHSIKQDDAVVGARLLNTRWCKTVHCHQKYCTVTMNMHVLASVDMKLLACGCTLVSVSQRLVLQLAKMHQQQMDSQRHRKSGTANFTLKEVAMGDPLLDDNPYFGDAVCRCYPVK